MPIPKIDPSVRHVSLAHFKRLKPEEMTASTFVVDDAVVVLPLPVFLEMQRCVEAAPMALQMPGPGVPLAQGGPVSTGHKADPSSPLRGV